MPSSPFLVFSGLGVTIIVIFLLALVAAPLTLLSSWLILWRYRITVARLMSEYAGEREGRLPIYGSTTHNSPFVVCGSQLSKFYNNSFTDHLYRQIISEPWRYAGKYALAGSLFALIVGLTHFFAFSQVEINPLSVGYHPFYLLFMCCTFAWPIAFTTTMFAATNLRTKFFVTLLYFIMFAFSCGLVTLIPTESPLQIGNLILPTWSGETPFRLIALWNLYNLAPTLLIITFRYRRIRSVAPLVLSFTTVVSAGWLSLMTMAFFIYQDISVAILSTTADFLHLSIFWTSIGYFLLLTLISCMVFGIIGWQLLHWVRSAYLRKKINDQSLFFDAIWFIFSAFYAAILAFSGFGWALVAFIAFIFFKISFQICNKITLAKSLNSQYGTTLLVLRVFSLGKRSEILFDTIAKHWCHVGNIQLIVGTDLASLTVSPNQFLAFVSGKLDQMFVNSKAAIQRSVRELDRQRDFDGRFRINTFFCHADTWQNVLSKLVAGTDVVLMDLRNFTAKNNGCIFEINELLNIVPLRQLVFIIDKDTEKMFLHQTLESVCRELRLESPNLGITPAQVQPLVLESLGYYEVRKLLIHLSSAAGVAHQSTVG